MTSWSDMRLAPRIISYSRFPIGKGAQDRSSCCGHKLTGPTCRSSNTLTPCNHHSNPSSTTESIHRTVYIPDPIHPFAPPALFLSYQTRQAVVTSFSAPQSDGSFLKNGSADSIPPAMSFSETTALNMSTVVLVTGATGLLGRQVFNTFKSSGCLVVGQGYSRANPPTILKANLEDPEDIKRILDDVK